MEKKTDLCRVYREFLGDFLTTFPEHKDTISANDGLMAILAENYESADLIITHCRSVFPPRFFDILYQNDDMFKEDIEFIPAISFKTIWEDETLTDKTRDVIWKYLQLVLFNTVALMNDGSDFGDTASLFEAIDETTLKEKMNETIEEMKKMFENNDIDISGNIPAPEDLNSHLEGLMTGKLGKLAQEIAKETADELEMDMEGATNDKDVMDKLMKQLFKNPMKIMGLVKKIGSKLETKMKSGELNEKEIMREATDVIQGMKKMGQKVPHMREMERMMKKMGGKMDMGNLSKMMGSMGSNPTAFVPNMGDIKSLQKEMEMSSQKDRMRRKLEERKKNAYVFSTGERPEQSVNQPTNRKKRNRKKVVRHEE